MKKPNNKANSKKKNMAAPPPPVDPNAQDGKSTYVAKDMIWKAYCSKADMTAKNWTENWGFLVDDQVN